jgi:hypothetical protein
MVPLPAPRPSFVSRIRQTPAARSRVTLDIIQLLRTGRCACKRENAAVWRRSAPDGVDATRAAGTRRLRPPLGVLWVQVVLQVIGLVIGAGVLAAGLHLRRTAPTVTGIVILAGCLCAVLLWPLMYRPLTVTPEALVYRDRRVALCDVTGVALICIVDRGIQGWFLRIWTSDAAPHAVGTFRAGLATRRGGVVFGTPDGKGLQKAYMRWVDYSPPVSDRERLAGTRAGRVAEAIYDAVIAVQGTAGPLAAAPAHRTYTLSRTRTPRVVSIWSPDGMFRTVE